MNFSSKIYLLSVLCLILFGCSNSNNPKCDGDCVNGVGTKLWSDGGYLKGNWKNGELYRQGSQFFGSTSQFAGDTYVGEFDHGYEGKGTYHFTTYDVVHVGEWKNGHPNGYGKRTFGSRSECPGSWYEGMWKDGKRNGFGIWYQIVNNDVGHWRKYIGNFMDANKEGEGKYYWADGNYYEGIFKNNVFDGPGTFIFKDGLKYKGNWRDGIDPVFETLVAAKKEKAIPVDIARF